MRSKPTLSPAFAPMVKKCGAANAALGRIQTYTFAAKLQNYSECNAEEEQGENGGPGPDLPIIQAQVSFLKWNATMV